MRSFLLLWTKEFHRPFPVIIGEVPYEYGLHFIHQFYNLFRTNIITILKILIRIYMIILQIKLGEIKARKIIQKNSDKELLIHAYKPKYIPLILKMTKLVINFQVALVGTHDSVTRTQVRAYMMSIAELQDLSFFLEEKICERGKRGERFKASQLETSAS